MLGKVISYLRPNRYENNIAFIQKRIQKQFNFISGKEQQDPRVLEATLQQLKQMPDAIYTFAARAKHFQYLNAIADANIQRVLAKPGTVPFSVKNQLKVKDMIQTCGYAVNASQNNMAKNSCIAVDILQNNGMTAYLQSNIPQGLWGIQSNNRVFGLSTNPYDERFISGGSSGGEAALVRMCCSAFGVGSDMAGSVRIPASFCGVYSFKPTGSRRLSRKGRLSLSGSEIQIIKQIDPAIGYLTRHISDLEHLLDLTMGKGNQKDWIVNGEWSQAKYKQNLNKKMVVGYMIDLPQIKTAPAIRDAILESVRKLEEQGHKAVEFKFDEIAQFQDNISKINATPGIYKTILNKLSGQPIMEHNQEMALLQTLGNWAITARIALCKDPEEKKIYENLRNISILQYFTVIAQNDILKERFISTWNTSKIDFLITPVTPFTSLLKGTSKYLINCLSFCCFQNCLEMPSGVVPVGLVKAHQTKYNDDRFFGRLAKQSIQKSEGLPVCVQITTKPFQDELCLAGMKILADTLLPIPLPKQFHIKSLKK